MKLGFFSVVYESLRETLSRFYVLSQCQLLLQLLRNRRKALIHLMDYGYKKKHISALTKKEASVEIFLNETFIAKINIYYAPVPRNRICIFKFQ